jgi:hypothetical protein
LDTAFAHLFPIDGIEPRNDDAHSNKMAVRDLHLKAAGSAAFNQRNVSQLLTFNTWIETQMSASIMSRVTIIQAAGAIRQASRRWQTSQQKVVAVDAGRATPDRLTEFHSLDAIEKAATKAALDRCRVLADQIEGELLKKGAEDFQDLTTLADFQASLEGAVEVLERTNAVYSETKTVPLTVVMDE